MSLNFTYLFVSYHLWHIFSFINAKTASGASETSRVKSVKNNPSLIYTCIDNSIDDDDREQTNN